MEPRNYESGASESAPIALDTPSVGYPSAGDPSTGMPATKPGPFWFYKIGESLRQLIVAAGLTPTDADLSLVSQAVAVINSPIGKGQSWQSLTASRAANVNYTNSTGKAIMVNIYRTDTANGANFIVDGVTVGAVNPEPAVGSTISAIVPDGSVYRFNDSFNIWAELR